jgi:hypothetical protein
MTSLPKHLAFSVVILSEAKDLRSRHEREPNNRAPYVRAQDSCAPACPDANFKHGLFLNLNLSL